MNVSEVNDVSEVRPNVKVIKTGTYRKRKYVVVEMQNPFSGIYCNGYVQVFNDKPYQDYDIATEELTYSGKLEGLKGFKNDGMFFIGFDTAHYWNDLKPETKKAPHVIKVCKRIINELNSKEGLPPK